MCQGRHGRKVMAVGAAQLNPDAKSSRNGGLPGSPCHASESKVSQKIGPSNDMRGYWPHRGVFTACKGRACEHSAQLRETPANLPAMEPHSQTSSTDNQVLHYTLHTEAPSDHPCARGHHGRKVMAAGAAMLNPAAKSSRETGVSQWFRVQGLGFRV